jgi:hypothetical protein
MFVDEVSSSLGAFIAAPKAIVGAESVLHGPSPGARGLAAPRRGRLHHYVDRAMSEVRGLLVRSGGNRCRSTEVARERWQKKITVSCGAHQRRHDQRDAQPKARQLVTQSWGTSQRRGRGASMAGSFMAGSLDRQRLKGAVAAPSMQSRRLSGSPSTHHKSAPCQSHDNNLSFASITRVAWISASWFGAISLDPLAFEVVAPVRLDRRNPAGRIPLEPHPEVEEWCVELERIDPLQLGGLCFMLRT